MIRVDLPADSARDVISALVGAQAAALETAGEYARKADLNFDLATERELVREYRDQASHHVERAERLYEAIEALRAALNAEPVIQLGVAS